jgi:hypothetical protein
VNLSLMIKQPLELSFIRDVLYPAPGGLVHYLGTVRSSAEA